MNSIIDDIELDKVDDKQILINIIKQLKKDNLQYKVGLNEISKFLKLRDHKDNSLIYKRKVEILEFKLYLYDRLLQNQNDYYKNNNILKENMIELNRRTNESLEKKNREISNLKKKNYDLYFTSNKLNKFNNHLIDKINNLENIIKKEKNKFNSYINNINKINKNEMIIHNNYTCDYPQNYQLNNQFLT